MMSLRSNLFNARKKSGLSQENVAEKLGGSADRPFQNGKPMKPCPISVNPNSFPFYIIYLWMN